MASAYLKAIFHPTLIIGFIYALLGISASVYFGSANAILAVMVIIGVVCAHISVNLMDDYVDHTSGLDRENVKTEYSGGSRFPMRNRADANNALSIAVLSAAIALAIGLFLAYSSPMILPLIAFGGVSVFCYTKYLAKLPYVSEPLTATNFALVATGSYMVVHGSLAHLGGAFLFAFMPAGTLLGILLLVNSLPDRVADKKHGRKNWIVMLGDNRRIARLYAASELFALALVIAGVALGELPLPFASVLVTLPFTFFIFREIRDYKSPKQFERCLAVNFFGTLVFLFLLVESFVVTVPLL